MRKGIITKNDCKEKLQVFLQKKELEIEAKKSETGCSLQKCKNCLVDFIEKPDNHQCFLETRSAPLNHEIQGRVEKVQTTMRVGAERAKRLVQTHSTKIRFKNAPSPRIFTDPIILQADGAVFLSHFGSITFEPTINFFSPSLELCVLRKDKDDKNKHAQRARAPISKTLLAV